MVQIEMLKRMQRDARHLKNNDQPTFEDQAIESAIATLEQWRRYSAELQVVEQPESVHSNSN